MIPKEKRSYQWKDRANCKCGNPKARRDQRMCGTCARLIREEQPSRSNETDCEE